MISLVSEVASAYIRLLAEQELLNLTEETVKAYKETLALVQTRYDSGYSSALTLAQSKTALHSAEATLAKYKLSVAQQYNTLRQLVGAPVNQHIHARLPQEDGRMLTDLKVGASSELLLSSGYSCCRTFIESCQRKYRCCESCIFPANQFDSQCWHNE